MAENLTFDKFLTPEAMLTPGVAGSLSMMIGNTLQHQFNLPNGWSVLALSFVFGMLVWAKQGPLVTRSVLYLLNSLVIFCTAVGAITLGATSADGSGGKKLSESFSIIQSAYAQSAADMQADYVKLSEQKNALWRKLKSAPDGANSAELQKQIEDVDKKQTQLLNSIAREAKGQGVSSGAGEKRFFAPLKF